MSPHALISGAAWRWRIVLTAVVASAVPARGQIDSPGSARFNSAATSTDAYGNVQFGLPERRPLGLFRFDPVQRQGGAMLLNRNPEQRGGDTLFALPGDLLGLATMTTLANTVSPGVSAVASQERLQSFRRYGGFGLRFQTPFQDPISAAFERRAMLMNATSQAAPVYRALAENSSMAGVRSAIVRTPFTPGAEDRLPESSVSLYQRLDARAATSYQRTRDEAWRLFTDGAFRLAARAFESVLVLSPDDLEARIGEVFSYVSSGAFRTAVTVVSDLGNHASNPFDVDLDMTRRFGDLRVATQLATDARLALESVAAARAVDVDATYVFMLWYLGRRDDATRFAALLARKPGAANYADWPAKMAATAPRAPADNPSHRNGN